MNGNLKSRLSWVLSEDNDAVARRKSAIKATRGSSERGLRQRMADRQVVIELREELKKHEEANA